MADADDFGGFGDEEFDDEDFGAAEDEDFGSAFEDGGAGGDDFGGFGDEDFEDFADADGDAIAEEEDDEFDDFGGDAAPAPKAKGGPAVPTPPAVPGGVRAPPIAKPAPIRRPAGPRLSGPRQTVTNFKALPVRLNRQWRAISQPFVAGYDMTTDSHVKVGDRGLRRIFLNAFMTAPGSFGVEIRTGPNGTGEVLAKDSGVRAPSNFARTTLRRCLPFKPTNAALLCTDLTRLANQHPVHDFNRKVVDFADDQPKLKDGETYHFHLILEQGAFKFQGAMVRTIKQVGPTKNVLGFSWKTNDKWEPKEAALVLKPVFQKVVPKIGDKSGFLLVKHVPRRGKGRSRASLRRKSAEGLRKFVVVDGGVIKQYTRPNGSVEKEIKMGDVEYVESKGGSIETKDFNVVTKTEEIQFAAPSASECQKWLKVLSLAQKTAEREFGSAATTNMMF